MEEVDELSRWCAERLGSTYSFFFVVQLLSQEQQQNNCPSCCCVFFVVVFLGSTPVLGASDVEWES